MKNELPPDVGFDVPDWVVWVLVVLVIVLIAVGLGVK